ncbi:MAG: cob(I)yrinic acid a,c-diamide adenosyltransferase [Promethearchaeota archaeon]
MSKRIYTGAGDKGQTGLRSGERIDKDDPRVEAYGTVDELDSFLGVAKAHASKRIKKHIHEIQQSLFYINAELAFNPESSNNDSGSGEHIRQIGIADVENLERIADELSEELPLLQNFVVPGGTNAGAFLHVCRTICRRAERRVLSLSKHAPINSELIRYLNRLSDLLFVFARYENVAEGAGDQLISREGIDTQRKS